MPYLPRGLNQRIWRTWPHFEHLGEPSSTGRGTAAPQLRQGIVITQILALLAFIRDSYTACRAAATVSWQGVQRFFTRD